MNRNEIERIAREAGWTIREDCFLQYMGQKEIQNRIVTLLERFAALVAAAEREACAREADYEAGAWPYAPEIREPCENIANAIRARGGSDE